MVNRLGKFTWDTLSEIRRGHLITPIDDINLFQCIDDVTKVEQMIDAIDKSGLVLSDKELSKFKFLKKIHHMDKCGIGYCTDIGFYDPIDKNIRWTSNRCPICNKKI